MSPLGWYRTGQPPTTSGRISVCPVASRTPVWRMNVNPCPADLHFHASQSPIAGLQLSWRSGPDGFGAHMPTRFQSVAKQPDLVQQIVDQLLKLISRGKLSVGDQIPPEAALSEQFGVSRTVTREAMQTLRGLGVIEVGRGRRPRIKQPGTDATIENIHLHLKLSRSPLLDQLEFRTPVESHIVELACERRSADHLAALRVALDERRDRRFSEASVDADLRFHRILAATTGNLLFEVMLSSIGELMRQAMNIDEHGASRFLMDQIHEDILEAVAARDRVRARHAMHRHMVESRKILLEQVED